MVNEFSAFELTLVRALLGKKTAGDIAGILARPVAEVDELITRLTKGGRKAYTEKVDVRTAVKNNKKLAEKAKRENEIIAKREYAGISKKQKKIPEKKYATRSLDLENKISVRLDHKTIIFVNRNADIELIKQQYRERDPKFLKPENPNVVVKKSK